MTGKSSKILMSFVLILSMTLALCACSGTNEQTEPLILGQSTKETEPVTNVEDEASLASKTQQTQKNDTYIILNNSNTTINGSGASFSQNTLKITKSGSYSVKGNLSNGQILIDSKGGEVNVVLYGVDIYCTYGAPIYVKSEKSKVHLVLAAGSVNSLSDSAERHNGQTEADNSACIYSCAPLELSGSGTLKISARFSKGIFCKTELSVSGGVYDITSTDDAVRAKDLIEIRNSTLTAVCGGDAIRTNAEEGSKGDIELYSSSLNLTSDLDSVRSTRDINIKDCSVTAVSGGGYLSGQTAPVKHTFGLGSNSESSLAETTISRKGLRALNEIDITSGTFKINSADDAFKSEGDLEISGGSFFIKSGDTALSSAKCIEISSGNIMITESQTGLSSEKIEINDGSLNIRAAKIGLQAQSSSGGVIKKSSSRLYNSDCIIKVDSGIVCVVSDKDGILSCGDIKLGGGRVFVVSGSSKISRTISCLGKFKQNDCQVLALGNGTVPALAKSKKTHLQFALSVGANTNVTITDKSGKAVVSFVSPKSFTRVFYCADSLTSGGEYNILCETEIQGSAIGGIYNTLNYSGGSTQGTFKAVF